MLQRDDINKSFLLNQDDYLSESGCLGLIHNSKELTLMHKWRYPSLSIHGISSKTLFNLIFYA